MIKKPYPSETQDRFIVRLPDGMRERIAQAAIENKRSMNAEIVARLERTFIREDSTKLGKVVSIPVEKMDEIFSRFLEDFERISKHEPSPSKIVRTPEFPDQADDIPMDPPKRRINTKRKL